MKQNQAESHLFVPFNEKQNSTFRINQHSKTVNNLFGAPSLPFEDLSLTRTIMSDREGRTPILKQLQSTHTKLGQWEEFSNFKRTSNSHLAQTNAAIHQGQSPFRRKACRTAGKSEQRPKAKTEKYSLKFLEPQENVGKLSLTIFHDKLRTTQETVRQYPQQSQKQSLNFKLQGLKYKQESKKNKIQEKNKITLQNIKKTLRKKQNEQITLQVKKISKQSNEKQALFTNVTCKKIPVPLQKKNTVSSSSKKNRAILNLKKTREHVQVNIINLVSEEPQRQSVECNQIYLKYIAKQKSQPSEHKGLNQIQLMKQLKQIKSQIASFSNYYPKTVRNDQKKSGRYTTSFIEQKLKKRQSLMQSYTFRKKAMTSAREQNPFFDDFYVEGWNNNEINEMIS